MKTTLLLIVFSSLVTSIQSQNLPYFTGFDNASEQSGWTFYREGDEGSSDWSMVGGGYSAPNSLHHDYNVGASENAEVIDWMVSPPLHFNGPVTISIKVSESGFSTPTDDNCLVYVGTGSQDPEIGNYTLIGNLSFITPQWTWVDTTFVSSITGEQCYLAFRYKTIGAAWCTYSIDDIEIELQDPSMIQHENALIQDLRIFPNPANDQLILTAMGDDNLSVQFNSVTGDVLKSCQMVEGQSLPIDISDFSAGVYFLSWSDGIGELRTKKLLVR